MTSKAHTPRTRSVITTCIIAVSALAVAMGIGRFAFTPMLPLMLRDGVISQNVGAWLAASNYLGYLTGALVAGRIRLSSSSLMIVSLVGTALATAAVGGTGESCDWLVLRFCAGVLSAWTLVATSTWALRELTRANRPTLVGVVYSGVGLGIAIVGLFCIATVRPGELAQRLWLELGVLAATISLIPAVLLILGRSSPEPAVASLTKVSSSHTDAAPSGSTGIIICYGLFGFGYILPATFLPALAREIADDPRLFGLAWPVFGIAAAVSTVLVAAVFGRFNRMRVWAVCHFVMAAGVLLPTIWLSLESIALAALLVGGTFMAITMLGLQEARSRAPDDPTTVLGRMTAAFALGQLAGPVASGALDLLSIGPLASLRVALQLAAFGLATSSVALLRLSRTPPDHRSIGMSGPT